MQLPPATPRLLAGLTQPMSLRPYPPSLAGGSLSLVLGLGRPVSSSELLSLVVGWHLHLPSCCVLGRGRLVACVVGSEGPGTGHGEEPRVPISPVTLPTCPQTSAPWPATGAQRCFGSDSCCLQGSRGAWSEPSPAHGLFGPQAPYSGHTPGPGARPEPSLCCALSAQPQSQGHHAV